MNYLAVLILYDSADVSHNLITTRIVSTRILYCIVITDVDKNYYN